MGWVMFFDGECAFCSASVRLVARLDTRELISFSPLQGRLAQEKGLSAHAVELGGTVVVLRETDGKWFTKSDAVIEVASALGGWWKIFTLARIIPRIIRDGVYRLVADNRYRLAGKNSSCSLPDPELLKRLRE